jgi:DNA-binding NarL/FixJ family response regulator
MIRVLLAEDHETVREGLRLLLNGQPDMSVVAEAGDGKGAIDQARAHNPHVVVLDLTMPGMNGLAAAKAIHAAMPATAVVALTRHADHAYLQELLAAGAVGYVLKQSASTELLKAIRAAVSGSRYLDPALGELETDRNRRRRASTPIITVREREVLRQIAVGYSNKEIAGALGISVKTVEVHKANAMRKLNLKGRTDVVRYASLNGWLSET